MVAIVCVQTQPLCPSTRLSNPLVSRWLDDHSFGCPDLSSWSFLHPPRPTERQLETNRATKHLGWWAAVRSQGPGPSQITGAWQARTKKPGGFRREPAESKTPSPYAHKVLLEILKSDRCWISIITLSDGGCALEPVWNSNSAAKACRVAPCETRYARWSSSLYWSLDVHGHPFAKTLFRRVPASAVGKRMYDFSDSSKALFMDWPAMLGPYFLFLPLQLALDGKVLRNRFMHVAITRYSEAAFVFVSSSVMRKVFFCLLRWPTAWCHVGWQYSAQGKPRASRGPARWSPSIVELWIARMPSQNQCHWWPMPRKMFVGPITRFFAGC